MVFVLALFLGLYWIIPVTDVLNVLSTVDPLLVTIGLLLGYVIAYLNAVILWMLSRQQGMEFSPWQLFVINLVVKFYLLFMPVMVGGSGIRWYKLSRPGGKSAEALVVIAFNQLFDMFMAVFLGLVFFLLSGQDSLNLNIWWLVGLIFLIGLVWFGLTRVSRPFVKWFQHLSEGTSSSMLQGIYKRLAKLMDAVANFADFPALDMSLIIFLGVLRNLLGVASYVFLARSIGIDLAVLDIGWIRSVIVLSASLPISIAGGLGLREIGLVAMFSLFGIGADVALAFSMLLLLRSLLLSLPGGIIEAVGALRSPRLT